MINYTEFIIYVSDQAKSRDFYQKVLLLEPVLDVNGMTEFQLSENTKLGIMPEAGIVKILGNKTPHPSSGTGIPRCELYLYVDNIEEYFSRALASGAKEVSEISPRDWGDTVGYLADSDGHIIAFAEKAL